MGKSLHSSNHGNFIDNHGILVAIHVNSMGDYGLPDSFDSVYEQYDIYEQYAFPWAIMGYLMAFPWVIMGYLHL